MPILKSTDFEVADRPELVIGLAAAVGTPLEHIQKILKQELQERGYETILVRLSHLMDHVVERGKEYPKGGSEFDRVRILMDRGNALRGRIECGDVLAALAAAEITSYRLADGESEEVPVLDGKAFILRQLKHPEEVSLLRQTYGDAFHLIGVYCPEETRRRYLIKYEGMTEEEASDLIMRDYGEEEKFGQQLRDTFHLADVIVRFSHEAETDEIADREIKRYIRLLFGDLSHGVESPTVDEYGMFLAFAASLRSADLSRQVGAAILNPTHEVVAVGSNEVPAPGGGQYWRGDPKDARDYRKGEDRNTTIKWEVLEEVVEVVDESFKDLKGEERRERLADLGKRLGPTRMMNLTEFGRAVHAEMEAILAAGRVGIGLRKCKLYTTTFPCHNCAKHIIGAGISRVVYVEPYPKSLALELHDDAIVLDPKEGDSQPVRLESFVGVAPRRFIALFSMISPDGSRQKRKQADGTARKDASGLRTRAAALNYMERERVVAVALKEALLGGQDGEE